MSLGDPSWIARHLLGDAGARTVQSVRSQTLLLDGVTGPWGGPGGGTSMALFQMTIIVTSEHVFVFADEDLLGWAEGAAQRRAVEDVWHDLRHEVGQLVGVLHSPGSCPVPLPRHQQA